MGEATVRKILVVGAGAVGQVFAWHLQRGGAEIAFLVKERYAEAARAGFTLYDLGRGRAPIAFGGFRVLTGMDEVAAERWDLVLLAVASPALRQGDWVAELARASGDATIAGLQPGLGDHALVQARAGAHRVVWGVIELVAYQAPLEGEVLPHPGVAFWIPWVLVFPYSGPDARVRAVVDAHRAGGLRARQVADTVGFTAVGSPALLLHMAALEAAGWRLSALSTDAELLATTAAAVRQAAALAAAEHGLSVPLWVRLLRPWHARLLAWAAPRVMPVDPDTYLRFHFTKVGSQTREQMARWLQIAQVRKRPADAIVALRDLLDDRGMG